MLTTNELVRSNMKIIELKIRHIGWYDNQAAILKAKNANSEVPYPNCDSPDVTVSILKVQISGAIIETKLYHSVQEYGMSKKEIFYLLKSQIIALIHNELDTQAKAILGDVT